MFIIWKYIASKPAKKTALIHSSPKVLWPRSFLVEHLHQKLVVQIFLDIISLCSFPCLIIFRSSHFYAGMVFLYVMQVFFIFIDNSYWYWWSCFILHLLHLWSTNIFFWDIKSICSFPCLIIFRSSHFYAVCGEWRKVRHK